MAAGLAACGGSSSTAPTHTSTAPTRAHVVTSPPKQVTATRTTTTTTTSETTSGTTSSSSSATASSCTPKDLGIHFEGGGAAAGTSYLRFAFVNVTGAPCTLQGYPGVSFVLASGATDDVKNIRSAAAAAPQTIGPGGRAAFVIGVPGQAASHCVKVTDFRFIPPNDKAYEQLRLSVTACGREVIVKPVGDTF